MKVYAGALIPRLKTGAFPRLFRKFMNNTDNIAIHYTEIAPSGAIIMQICLFCP